MLIVGSSFAHPVTRSRGARSLERVHATTKRASERPRDALRQGSADLQHILEEARMEEGPGFIIARLRSFLMPYSPNIVEGEFSEVRGHGVLRSSTEVGSLKLA